MLQVMRYIAVLAIAVGVSTADSEVIFIPFALVILGVVLLNLSDTIDKEGKQ